MEKIDILIIIEKSNQSFLLLNLLHYKYLPEVGMNHKIKNMFKKVTNDRL